MNINPKELENVSRMKPFDRYEYFIRKVADFQELWTIVDEEGEVALSEIKDNKLVSFWTSEPFIESNLSGGWKNCSAFKLHLEDLDETIFPLISDNNYLINVFPVNGKSGFVVNIDEFIRDLNEELEQYE